MKNFNYFFYSIRKTTTLITLSTKLDTLKGGCQLKIGISLMLASASNQQLIALARWTYTGNGSFPNYGRAFKFLTQPTFARAGSLPFRKLQFGGN